MVTGLGGFHNPIKMIFDSLKERFHRRGYARHISRTKTIRSVKTGTHLAEDTGEQANYISFDALVGRNSRFLSLTSEQRDELGGVEYRGLSLLFRIVLGYILLVQLIPMAIFCPLFDSRHYSYLFQDAGTVTGEGAFFAAFNINSAYANAGLSLLDASMVPFQGTYGFSLVMGFEILAGNVAFPIFLRLIIWTLSKIVRKNSRLHESLTFLLDHPRRCFFYLFPS
jgi:Trk-type K+ transport system membrane component